MWHHLTFSQHIIGLPQKKIGIHVSTFSSLFFCFVHFHIRNLIPDTPFSLRPRFARNNGKVIYAPQQTFMIFYSGEIGADMHTVIFVFFNNMENACCMIGKIYMFPLFRNITVDYSVPIFFSNKTISEICIFDI